MKPHEILSTLNEVRFEIARLNRAFGETVFNPAVTQLVEAAQSALRESVETALARAQS